LPLVSAELQKEKPSPPIPTFDDPGKVERIVLAAYSGGGKVMLALARPQGADPYADRITLMLGLDDKRAKRRNLTKAHIIFDASAPPRRHHQTPLRGTAASPKFVILLTRNRILLCWPEPC